MFYSRPKIEPFGWDLLDLPTRNGSKHFDALTSDRRPVDFRFGGGWLSVEIGPAGSAPDGPDMKEVLSLPISPFGTMDIQPEQICDILGITVNGRKIDSAGIATGARGFDWSGRTTYWQSTHRMLSGDDAREFVRGLGEAFPDSILVQPEWGSHGRLRCRRIGFLLASDKVVALGLGPNLTLLDKTLSGDKISTEEFESTFGFCILFSHEESFLGDATGSKHISQEAAGLGLRYTTIEHRRYRISVQYSTHDALAQARMKILLARIEASFCRGLQVVNLRTGAVIVEDLSDGADERSYSIALRDEWLADPSRYLFVGKTIDGNEFGCESGVLFGARPNASGVQARA